MALAVSIGGIAAAAPAEASSATAPGAFTRYETCSSRYQISQTSYVTMVGPISYFTRPRVWVSNNSWTQSTVETRGTKFYKYLNCRTKKATYSPVARQTRTHHYGYYETYNFGGYFGWWTSWRRS